MKQTSTLLLEDGTTFVGTSVGITGYRTGEVVFNTAMSGYQEIISDPSYAEQIITFTFPHIGIVGTNDEDDEAARAYATGVVMRDYAEMPSSWRSQGNLRDYLIKQKIVGIAGIDTRQLTRHLRAHGILRGVLYTNDIDLTVARNALSEFAGLTGVDVAQRVTTKHNHRWCNGSDKQFCPTITPRSTKRNKDKLPIIAYDFGIKHSILRMLTDCDCDVTVVPARTPVSEVLALNPAGVFLSNGPGDPEPCDYAITAIQKLLEVKKPVFGICLGHQLLCLACGAQSIKMKFGHHGANHPVQDMDTKQVFITSQNHNFCIDEKTLPASLAITHRSLFDGTLQGVRHLSAPAFGFQGHPEASPGPHDISALFQMFSQLMRDYAETN